jgi:hypothetical protein
MAARLGYDFDQSHLKNTSYFPEGYGMTMLEQQAIRKAALDLLTGRTALPMHIVNVPGGGAQAAGSDPIEAGEQQVLESRAPDGEGAT